VHVTGTAIKDTFDTLKYLVSVVFQLHKLKYILKCKHVLLENSDNPMSMSGVTRRRPFLML